MFSSLGLFKDISCPKGAECVLLNCIFAHHHEDLKEEDGPTYDPASAGIHGDSIIQQRRKPLEATQRERPAHVTAIDNFDQQPLKKQRLDNVVASKELSRNQRVFSPAKTAKSSLLRELSSPSSSKLDSSQTPPKANYSAVKSVGRSISPPPIRGSKKHLSKLTQDPIPPPISTPAEPLNPRMVSRAPESHKNRLAFLKLMHQLMEELNKRLKESSKVHLTILTPQELARLALDEEERIAKGQLEGLYRSTITGLITRLKKMALDDWRKFVMEKIPGKVPPERPVKIADPASTAIVTGLKSIKEELAILELLRKPLEGLEAYGYVTTPLSAKEIEESRKGVQSAMGFEVCDRCGTRFQVFPGRNDEGRLTSHGFCHYHWAKLRRPERQKTDRTTGQAESSYACCSKGLGSEGCTTATTHVFKVTDPKRLASVSQFKQTPVVQYLSREMPDAVAFDCEMGYTTLGLELIRITAISWPQNRQLLDVLVRTQGEVLDLNTRFSGVSTEAYISAPVYDAAESDQGDGDETSEEGKLEPEPLRKVGSPDAARALMFELLTPETPLIGHAIDNDLNACRIIHPFVVDTVLLYPHPRGLPIRFGLKMLTNKYLDRGIQLGGALGHDSKEDATATGDLVKLKVREEWQRLRLEGWRFEDGRLVAPESEDG